MFIFLKIGIIEKKIAEGTGIEMRAGQGPFFKDL